jgi:hypothetical protein
MGWLKPETRFCRWEPGSKQLKTTLVISTPYRFGMLFMFASEMLSEK